MQEKLDKRFSISFRTLLVAGIGIIGILLFMGYFAPFQQPESPSTDGIIDGTQTQVQTQPPLPTPEPINETTDGQDVAEVTQPSPQVPDNLDAGEEEIQTQAQIQPPLPSPVSINEIDNGQDVVDVTEPSQPEPNNFDSQVEEILETLGDTSSISETDDSSSNSQPVQALFVETPVSSEDITSILDDSTEIDDPVIVTEDIASTETPLQESEFSQGFNDDAFDNVAVEQEPAASITESRQTIRTGTPGNDDNVYKLDVIPEPIQGIKGENWYREQNRSFYALQLVSAADLGNVLGLIEGLDAYHDEFSGYVKYTPSGKPRYLLFYGLYPNLQAASTAVKEIVPDRIKVINPFPRKVGHIVDEIEIVGDWPR